MGLGADLEERGGADRSGRAGQGLVALGVGHREEHAGAERGGVDGGGNVGRDGAERCGVDVGRRAEHRPDALPVGPSGPGPEVDGDQLARGQVGGRGWPTAKTKGVRATSRSESQGSLRVPQSSTAHGHVNRAVGHGVDGAGAPQAGQDPDVRRCALGLGSHPQAGQGRDRASRASHAQGLLGARHRSRGEAGDGQEHGGGARRRLHGSMSPHAK